MSNDQTDDKEPTATNEKDHVADPTLLEAFRYVNSVPGKNVRGKLVDCFQMWLRVLDGETLEKIKDIIGDLHNASLLIDDIEDNSKLRRGIPVAHSIFGIPTTINTANYVYFLALDKCRSLDNAQAMQVFCSELLNLHRGQGHDICWRDGLTCPTFEEYYNMISDKTGGLFRLAVGLMQAFATTNKSTDFSPLVNNLAIYFQIRDDFINLADEEYMKSKSFCEDLTEGKFSFPIIHCIREQAKQPNGGDTRLLNILKQRTEDVDVKRYAQSMMREAGSLAFTYEKCRSLKEEIMEQVETLGGNPPLLKLLHMLDVQLEKLAGDAVAASESEVGLKEDSIASL